MPAGTVLREYNGNLKLTASGTYSGLDIRGFVYVMAPNVVLQNSIIRGAPTTSRTGLVTNLTDSAKNFVLRHSEIVPDFPSDYIDGMTGWNYTLDHVNIHGTKDGAKIFGNDVTIVDSYIHDLSYYANDQFQNGGPSHNDAIQILGGKNISIHRNTLRDGSNAALQVTQTKGPVTNLTFTRNWTGGGACTVNLQDAPLTSMTGITLDSNLFSRTSKYNCAVIAFDGVSFNNLNNKWLDAPGAITVVRRS
ncbi:hypothetical protein [Jatrophihabitans fulvus]